MTSDGLHRRLPSGLWQATVRGRDGKRHTETDRLKSVVKDWAAQQEAAIARGDFRDPHLGDIRVGDWHVRVSRARGIEDVTKAKNASLWRTHCEPEWAGWQMAASPAWRRRPGWTAEGHPAGPAQREPVRTATRTCRFLSPATIHDAVHIMSQLYTAAMREHPPSSLVNPFDHLELPKIEPRAVEFLEHEEAEALYAAVRRSARSGGPFELGTEVGLRRARSTGCTANGSTGCGQIQVIDVMTRKGLRQGRSQVPPGRPGSAGRARGHVALMAGRPRDGLVFTAPEGGLVADGIFRDRVWCAAVGGGRGGGGEIRRFPPRVMRHTAASWLVQRRGAAVRRPCAVRPRGLRDDAAVRAPRAGRARQGHRVVGEAP